MKITRFIKLRTFGHGACDLALENTRNPLKRKINVTKQSHEFTADYLAQFKVPLDVGKAQSEA